MEITKEDILDNLKEDILDRLSEDCYQWIFEDSNEVCEQFAERLVKGVLAELSENFKNALITEMKSQIIDEFIDRNDSYLCTAIKDEIKDKLLNKIEVSVQCKTL